MAVLQNDESYPTKMVGYNSDNKSMNTVKNHIYKLPQWHLDMVYWQLFIEITSSNYLLKDFGTSDKAEIRIHTLLIITICCSEIINFP